MNSNKVWVKMNNDWIEGELLHENLSKDKYLISIHDETFETCNYEKHNNVENLKKDNLVDIPHLNEPSILQAIHLRYSQDIIYTYTGKILISLNPFKNLNLFTDETIQSYKRNSKNLRPHLYQIADDAYKNLLKFNHYSPDVAIVDPPRSGLVPKALYRLIEQAPRTILYISCNPSTLLRDLGVIRAAGYRVVRFIPVDMFPHSFHLECVVKLCKV